MQAATSLPQPSAKSGTTPAPQAGVTTAPLAAPAAGLSIRQLTALRDEISRQVGNVRSRRNDYAAQLRTSAPGVDRAGVESQIATLDKRIIDLENQLDVTGRALIQARGAAATIETPRPGDPSNLNSDQITGIAIVFTIAVLMPLSIAWAKAIFRRAKHATEAPSPEFARRLERMEEGIDAIAVEVERISEGQRFVTRLLGEGAAPPVPVAANQRAERVETRR